MLKDSFKLALPFLVLAGIFWWMRAPDPETVWRQSTFSQDFTRIESQGESYSASWEEDLSAFEGELQQMVPEALKYAPFISHHLVLTDGDYSDPDKVEIRPLKKGKTSWRAKQQPRGRFLVLHLLPADAEVLRRINAIAPGQRAIWSGQRLVKGRLENSKGGYFQVNNTNHIVLLLRDVQPVDKAL